MVLLENLFCGSDHIHVLVMMNVQNQLTCVQVGLRYVVLMQIVKVGTHVLVDVVLNVRVMSRIGVVVNTVSALVRNDVQVDVVKKNVQRV